MVCSRSIRTFSACLKTPKLRRKCISGRDATADGDAANTVPGDGRETVAVVITAGSLLDRDDGVAATEVHRQL